MKFVFALFLFTVACEFKEKPEFSPPGGRERLTTPKTRLTPTAPADTKTASVDQSIPANQTAPTDQTNPANQTADSSKTESLIFPIIPSASHTSFTLKSSDYKKIIFSAKPSSHPLSLIAGLSGTISLKSSNGMYYLTLTPKKGNLALHFELSEAETTLNISDQAQVTQNQNLLTSNKPILFYTTENSKISFLCINTTGLEKVLTVIKELPDTDECS